MRRLILFAALLFAAVPCFAQTAVRQDLSWTWTGAQSEPPCAPSTTTGTITIALNAPCANPVSGSGSPDLWQFTLTGSGTIAVTGGAVGQVFRLEVAAGTFSLALPTPFNIPSSGNTAFAGNSVLVCSVHDLTGPNYWCPGGVQTNLSPAFTPLTLAYTKAWFDASDSSTLYTGAACTGATVTAAGNTIGSWKDKSANGYCAVSVGSPVWQTTYITFNGTSQYFTLPAGALSMYQNVSWGMIAVGAQYTAATAQGGVFFETNSGATRVKCSSDTSVNSGPDVGSRVQDADAAASVSWGTDLTTALSQECVYHFIGGGGLQVAVNNGTAALGTFASSSATATSNTASGHAALGAFTVSGTANSFLNGRLYQVVLTVPTSAPSGTDETNLASFVCKKVGISC